MRCIGCGLIRYSFANSFRKMKGALTTVVPLLPSPGRSSHTWCNQAGSLNSGALVCSIMLDKPGYCWTAGIESPSGAFTKNPQLERKTTAFSW